MSELGSGKERVQQLCDLLKKETLEPAQKEVGKILEEAQSRREALINEGRLEAERVLEEAKAKIEEERKVFDSSLSLAGKQALLALKQEIEGKLFNRELSRQVEGASSDPKMVAKTLEALVLAVEKEGIDSDLLAFIPKAVSKEEVVKELSSAILERLKKESVQLAEFTGGAKVKIVEDHLTLDMSDEALKRLVASFIREDLKAKLFA